MTVDELVAILRYDLKGEGNLNRFNRGLDQSEKKAKASAAAIGVAGRALGGFLAGAASASAVAGAVRQSAALERQMTRTGLAAGATAAETKMATLQVARLATDIALPLDQAYAGLDALVATGKTMPEALGFLPSVLKTAQASGAATDEIANTADALSVSFKVAGSEMQRAFDYLVTGGQLGKFELKDMARYLPSLTASAQKLGFTGLNGTQKLVAMLQTVRQVSGTSEEAATAAKDAFEKLLSPTVAKQFKGYGVDIGKVLEQAAKKGQNGFEAVLDVLTKLTRGMSDTQRDIFLSRPT